LVSGKFGRVADDDEDWCVDKMNARKRTNVRRPVVLVLAAVALAASGHASARATSCVSSGSNAVWQPQDYPRDRKVLRVGPTRTIKSPGEAARKARDGDVILIDGGDYPDANAVWKANGLLIRGVEGRPHLIASEGLAQGKAIWVINGADVIVENIEFSGARIKALNGAGIRAQGRGLTVRGAFFHDNQNGILTSPVPDGWLVVEHSEFARNGAGDGKSHNLYVGRIARFEMRHSYSHGARQGHLVKSRAAINVIEYNRLVDDADGTASYEIDLPNGGQSLVLGNLIVQSATSPNHTIVAFGAETAKVANPGNLVLVHNTIYSRRARGTYVVNKGAEPALLFNNLMAGSPGPVVQGAHEGQGNLTVSSSEFVDARSDNFNLTTASRATDAAAELPPELGPGSSPAFEPSEPLVGKPRPKSGTRDAGAFEFCDGRAP
jgi:hypothetical protein